MQRSIIVRREISLVSVAGLSKATTGYLIQNECTAMIRYVLIEYEYNLLALKALLYLPQNLLCKYQSRAGYINYSFVTIISSNWYVTDPIVFKQQA